MKTYTLKDLAELVKAKEAELAPGSETTLLGAFVSEYDYTDRCIEDRGDEEIDEDTYQEWVDAYKKLKLEDKFVIAYSSTFVPCGVKLIGNPEDCTPEYPDTVELFCSHADALGYIKRYEPTLDQTNIAPASRWL